MTRPCAKAGQLLRQAAGDVLVGQAVKAIAAHADVRDGTRQGEPSGDRRHGCDETPCRSMRPAAERGTRLRQPRAIGARLCGMMQRRRAASEPSSAASSAGVIELRCNMSGTAMHDAVADGCQPVATKMRVGQREQCVEEGGERRRGTCRPAFLGQNIPVGITSEHMRTPRPGPRSHRARLPSAWLRSSNRANFMLDEPALSVRIDALHAAYRGPGAVLSARPARRMPGKRVRPIGAAASG